MLWLPRALLHPNLEPPPFPPVPEPPCGCSPPSQARLIAGRALDVLPRMAARGYDMVVLDGDLDETPQYLDHAVRIVRPGGTIAFVHALWHDQVADPARRDARTVVAREVVNYLRDSDEFVPTLLPVGDGLAVAVKR